MWCLALSIQVPLPLLVRDFTVFQLSATFAVIENLNAHDVGMFITLLHLGDANG